MLDVSSPDLVAIVRTVFEAVFELEASAAPQADAPQAAVASSLVAITGTWNGAVLVDCPHALATDLAAMMFALDVAAIDPDHIDDTLAELANMIGGNLKALLEPPCRLSLPTNLEHREVEALPPGTVIVRDLSFDVAPPGGPGRLRVLVVERAVATEVGDREAA